MNSAYNVAILDFINQKSVYVFTNMFIGLLDHKNICLDTNVAFVSALVLKTWAFTNFGILRGDYFDKSIETHFSSQDRFGLFCG